MTREIIISSKDWIRYADSVGDYNSAHRDKKNLVIGGKEIPGPIAPGMYTASRFQIENSRIIPNYEDDKIQNIRITFGGTISDGELVRIVEDERGFKFYNANENSVCNVSINDARAKKDVQEAFNSGYFVYKINLGTEQIQKFMESIHVYSADCGFVPKMQVAALSASALLNYAEKTQDEKEGIHIYQSVIFNGRCLPGDIEVRVVEQEPTRFRNFGLTWFQGNKLIASGKSIAAALNL